MFYSYFKSFFPLLNFIKMKSLLFLIASMVCFVSINAQTDASIITYASNVNTSSNLISLVNNSVSEVIGGTIGDNSTNGVKTETPVVTERKRVRIGEFSAESSVVTKSKVEDAVATVSSSTSNTSVTVENNSSATNRVANLAEVNSNNN